MSAAPDGFAEDDWEGFRAQTATFGDLIQIVGDDLYVTNPRFIRGIKQHATNAVLIKLNQIGTVTETVKAIETRREAGWNYIISHRSGETEDSFYRRLCRRHGRRSGQGRLTLAQRAIGQIQQTP